MQVRHRRWSQALLAGLLISWAGGCSGSGEESISDGAVEAVGGTAGTAGGGAGGSGGVDGNTSSDVAPTGDRFSFFITSLRAMQRLSGSESGFGGDLRFGQPDGLSGADEICRRIAEDSLPGSGAKGWRAFLSATKGPDGQPVHAIDRVGEGPWYDRLGRLVALNKTDLAQTRPAGAHSAIINDLPNEDGVPNQSPDGTPVDNHDTLTGSDRSGRLYLNDWSVTCHDWTSSVGGDGKPRMGHSWPGGRRATGGSGGPPGGSGDSWISSLDGSGCAPGVHLIQTGPPDPRNPTVGSGGGYGAIYCLALSP